MEVPIATSIDYLMESELYSPSWSNSKAIFENLDS